MELLQIKRALVGACSLELSNCNGAYLYAAAIWQMHLGAGQYLAQTLEIYAARSIPEATAARTAASAISSAHAPR